LRYVGDIACYAPANSLKKMLNSEERLFKSLLKTLLRQVK
jgi:hypothetical protein